jgi:tetratricopeptide (TPR) repeat protein
MRFLTAEGRAAQALKTYEQYRQRLWEELGIEPEQATTALVQKAIDNQAPSFLITSPGYASLDIPDLDELPAPGPLPPHSSVPYSRNPDFVGRKAELLRIASSFRVEPKDGRLPLVALTGMGGIGKTQTAVEFCHRYGLYFPGGVFWMSFAEADNVAEEVAAAGGERGLGLFREGERLTLADRVGRVQRAWQEPAPRLLVFDNCEEAKLLAEWLPVTGGCRVLVTSRRGNWPRELGMAAVSLNPLTPGESARLLQRLAPHLSEPELRDIAQEIGHLPLALHLAGSFFHRYRQSSPAAYMAQLQERGALRHPALQGRGASYSPTGHELDVARTCALSWERLDNQSAPDAIARQLLIRAACLAPGEPIPTRWLKTTLKTEHDPLIGDLLAEDGLARLFAVGFLRAGAGETAVLHRLLAQFTQEVCGPVQIQAARAAVTAGMAHTLSTLYEKQGHLSTLPFSVSHLRHVIEGDTFQKTSETAAVTTLLGLHLINVGEFVEAEDVLKQAASLAGEMGDIERQAMAFSVLASTQESLGYDRESLQSAEAALSLFRQAQPANPAGLVQALCRKGFAHYRLGQAEAALADAAEGYQTAQEAGLPVEMARCRILMGIVNYYLLGNYHIAQQQLEESLAVYREAGHHEAESSVLNNLGENARLQGDYPGAVAYYEAALAIANDINSQDKARIILSNLCGARLRLGQYDVVTDLEGLIAEVAQDWFGLSEAYRFLAEAYLGQEKTGRALAMARQALALAYEENLIEHGRAWRVLGLVAARLGEPVTVTPDAAERYSPPDCFRKSLEYFDSLALERDRAISLWRWAEHLLAAGEEQQGQALWHEARQTFERLNLPLFVEWMEGAVG